MTEFKICVNGYDRHTDITHLSSAIHLALTGLSNRVYFEWMTGKTNPVDLSSHTDLIVDPVTGSFFLDNWAFIDKNRAVIQKLHVPMVLPQLHKLDNLSFWITFGNEQDGGKLVGGWRVETMSCSPLGGTPDLTVGRMKKCFVISIFICRTRDCKQEYDLDHTSGHLQILTIFHWSTSSYGVTMTIEEWKEKGREDQWRLLNPVKTLQERSLGNLFGVPSPALIGPPQQCACNAFSNDTFGESHFFLRYFWGSCQTKSATSQVQSKTL